jgi:hypothetical protein
MTEYDFPIRVKMVVSIGYVGAEHTDEIEVTEEDLNGMKLEDYLDAYLIDMQNNHLDSYWEILEDE